MDLLRQTPNISGDMELEDIFLLIQNTYVTDDECQNCIIFMIVLHLHILFLYN